MKLYVIIMSRTSFRVNLQSIVAWTWHSETACTLTISQTGPKYLFTNLVVLGSNPVTVTQWNSGKTSSILSLIFFLFIFIDLFKTKILHQKSFTMTKTVKLTNQIKNLCFNDKEPQSYFVEYLSRNTKSEYSFVNPLGRDQL